MRRTRRVLALALTALLLLSAPVLASGCGSTGHFVGGVVAHHIANHFARTPAGRRRVDKAFCLYHGRRVLVDLRTHHTVAAGLNAIAAYRSCRSGFGHR